MNVRCVRTTRTLVPTDSAARTSINAQATLTTILRTNSSEANLYRTRGKGRIGHAEQPLPADQAADASHPAENFAGTKPSSQNDEECQFLSALRA